LGYYFASRALWDINEASQLQTIYEDFLEKSFGEAREPMREFYRLINFDSQRRSPSDLLARMYRQLDAARKATADAKVHARIDDLILYTRHAELYYAHANGHARVEDVARHAYRIRKTMMVHSYGLWCRLVSQQAALTPDHPWKSEEPFSRPELDAILANGIAKHMPVEPGFEAREFSRDLVPAAKRLQLDAVAAGSFPTHPQDHQQYFIWLPDEAKHIELAVTVEKVWANRMPKLTLSSPQEVSLKPVHIDETYRPDGQRNTLKLTSPYAGLHRIETFDGGDYTRISWPEHLPVTIESGIDTPDTTSHFRGAWSLYFYVPKGTKVVGGWASRIANWAPRISGTLQDASGKVLIDFAQREDGWFKVDLPQGQDGKLWKFSDTLGQRLLMTVPPYLARDANELLLPKEVVEQDEVE
jgi:hypothetical protein